MTNVDSRIGPLEFTHDFENGYPTAETAAKLFDEMDFQRATQVYLWALPLVSFAQWQHEQDHVFGAPPCAIVRYRDYVDKAGLLTANATTLYAGNFIDLAQIGPVVIDIPDAEVRGATHSMWQIAITEMVKPGRYVFHPPGTEPPLISGSSVFESPTNSIFFGIRLMSTDDKQRDRDLAAVKVFPLSALDSPPDTVVIDVAGRHWEGWQPRGLAYFERLADIVARESIAERDRFFMAMLRPLGIGRGISFAPSEQQRQILESAALVGEAMAKANDFVKLPRLPQAEYVAGSHWEIATVSPPDQRFDDYDDIDGRAAWFYEAVTNDPAMQSNTPGEGQIYLGAYQDADGDWLDGAVEYVLHVGPDVPAAAFWSITVYDVSTRCLIDNGAQIADRSSRMDLMVEGDGTTDIHIGPNPPEGKEGNWIPTVPGKAWFAYFRFYSPTQPYFDRTWVLADIVKA